MKNKKNIFLIACIVIIISIIIFIIVFKNNTSKNSKIGKNSSSQEIVNYILNISTYQTTIEVEITSNKNRNKYIIKQNYNGIEDNMQEIIEPSNIAGVKIIKKDKELKIENSKLNLTSIFQDYEYISDNGLDLSAFIKDYKEDSEAEWEEKDGTIIMNTSSGEKVKKYKTLYINKENGMPEKMEIRDNNKNTVVYILYNEVSVNS